MGFSHFVFSFLVPIFFFVFFSFISHCLFPFPLQPLIFGPFRLIFDKAHSCIFISNSRILYSRCCCRCTLDFSFDLMFLYVFFFLFFSNFIFSFRFGSVRLCSGPFSFLFVRSSSWKRKVFKFYNFIHFFVAVLLSTYFVLISFRWAHIMHTYFVRRLKPIPSSIQKRSFFLQISLLLFCICYAFFRHRQ